MYYTKYY